MGALEIYQKLPPPVQQAVMAGYSFKLSRARYGRVFRETLEFFERSELWTPEEARRYQSERLLTLLREAKAHTAYYRESLASFSDKTLREIASDLDMARLPLVPKSVVKARTPDFFSSKYRTVLKSKTSGSTGTPMEVEYDHRSLQERWAMIHHQRVWAGLKPRGKCLRATGKQFIDINRTKPPFWVYHPFENQLLVSTYHLEAPYFPSIVDEILKFAPEVVDGYPTSIMMIARYCRENGIKIPSIKMVNSSAETLTPEIREMIERGFDAPLYDYYAASEGVGCIQQCSEGTYHVRLESGIFEILRPDGTPAGPGEVGELVATGFYQRKTPLIRYTTGDLLTVPKQETRCPCGRATPTIAGVLGRMEDMVETKDGRSLGLFSHRTLKQVSGIKEAQIIQKGTESFLINIVYDGSMKDEAVNQAVRQAFHNVLGYESAIQFVPQSTIPRGPGGKFRVVIREMPTKAKRLLGDSP